MLTVLLLMILALLHRLFRESHLLLKLNRVQRRYHPTYFLSKMDLKHRYRQEHTRYCLNLASYRLNKSDRHLIYQCLSEGSIQANLKHLLLRFVETGTSHKFLQLLCFQVYNRNCHL